MLLAFSILAGLLLGSFLNVCIARLPLGESVVTPRSRCSSCGHLIRWYDNIPLLSYVFLRAKCRDCKSRISLQYPLVELATAVWFAYIATHAVTILQAVNLCTLGFLLIGLAVMDWQTHLLPDAFTLTGIFGGMLLVGTRAIFLGPNEDAIMLGANHIRINSAGAGKDLGNVFMTGPEHLIFGRLLAVVVAFLILAGIRAAYKAVRKRDGMGLGDAKLLAMVAAFLGLAPALLALFCGVLLATVYAVFLLMRRSAGAATRLPFGSFLAAGAMFAALFGQHVVDWYTGLLR